MGAGRGIDETLIRQKKSSINSSYSFIATWVMEEEERINGELKGEDDILSNKYFPHFPSCHHFTSICGAK
jgi:hypothetical protein